MNESVLIVDDEKEIADLIEVYLKNDGYTVHKFYNGLDALECIETQKIGSPESVVASVKGSRMIRTFYFSKTGINPPDRDRKSVV